jgi:hypothetical protein
LVGLAADPPTITLEPGQSQKVTLSGTISNVQPADDSSLSAAAWKSDNVAVVQVSNGTATAVAPGSATVTATVGNLFVPIPVNVTPPATTAKSTTNTTRARTSGGGSTGGEAPVEAAPAGAASVGLFTSHRPDLPST